LTIASDKDPAPTQARQRWTRAAAIEAFGVRYVQRRSWREPVVEALGSHATAEEALEGCRTYATESSAIQRVQAEAREDATRELDRCDAFLDARSVRFRLSLARTWRVARRKEVGILATSSILEQRRREQRALLRNGVSVPVRRLPDPIRLPVLLDEGVMVHVVDTRGFPRSPLRIESRPILALSFVEAPSHPDFDQLVRYRVRNLDGLGYDHVARSGDRLSGAPTGVEVFLELSGAEGFVGGYATDVLARLGRPDAPLPAIDHVTDAPEPLPALPSVPPVPEDAAGDPSPAIASAATRTAPALSRPAEEALVAAVAAAIAVEAAEPGRDALPRPDGPVEPSPALPEAREVPVEVPPAAEVAWSAPPRNAPVPLDTPEVVVAAETLPGGGPSPEPQVDASEMRPAPRPRAGLLARLFGRRPPAAAEPEPEPEGEPVLFAVHEDPVPETVREDHLPEGIIIDEMETAVVELAAASRRDRRPTLPPPPAYDPRHPETSAFLARGGLVVLTSAPEGSDTPATRLVATLRPELSFADAGPAMPATIERPVPEPFADLGPGLPGKGDSVPFLSPPATLLLLAPPIAVAAEMAA
jgi:hypothetical protein